MVDANGFRPNVGIILINHDDRVFWAKRLGRNAWQFPQGGIAEGENPEQALFRELEEEVGLRDEHVTILGRTRNWLKYRIPTRMVRKTEPRCIGQKQLWFLLRLEVDESYVRFNETVKPEFDGWQWVSYWYPLSEVISFKKEVYRRALKELSPYAFRNAVRRWGIQPLNRLLE